MTNLWKGYAIKDTSKWDQFEVIDFEPKQQGDWDVDVKIDFCGVCGSDLHTITGGWGDPILPVIPGHEIVGHVFSVGPGVTEFKVGDRVGVGAMVSSCFECKPCKTNNENYCLKGVDTYNATYPNGDIAQGGYSRAIRVDERFVFPIPKALASEMAAPMMCAGLTVYSPLKYHGAGPGKTVGVVGIGGLGHFALQFAKALGADRVVAFSHSSNKKADAFNLGATDFVVTGQENWSEPWEGQVDIIICTVDASVGIALTELLSTLTVHGRFVMVALPDDNLPEINAMDLASNGCLIGGSHIGSKKDCIEMLNLAAEKGIESWIQLLPMSEAGQAVRNMRNGKVRYRHVLKVDI